MTGTARVLRLVRTRPEPGQAAGTVAEAAVFSDGTAVLHWLTEPGATELYDSEEAMRAVRERSGRSVFREPVSQAGGSTTRYAMLRILRDAGGDGLAARRLLTRMAEEGMQVRRETLHVWLGQCEKLDLARRGKHAGQPVWIATGTGKDPVS